MKHIDMKPVTWGSITSERDTWSSEAYNKWSLLSRIVYDLINLYKRNMWQGGHALAMKEVLALDTSIVDFIKLWKVDLSSEAIIYTNANKEANISN